MEKNQIHKHLVDKLKVVCQYGKQVFANYFQRRLVWIKLEFFESATVPFYLG